MYQHRVRGRSFPTRSLTCSKNCFVKEEMPREKGTSEMGMGHPSYSLHGLMQKIECAIGFLLHEHEFMLVVVPC